MARKRIELGNDAEAMILAHASRGSNARQIFDALGGTISQRTIARRLEELKASGAFGSAEIGGADPSDDSQDIPSSPDAFSSAMSIEMVDKWIARINVAAQKAEQLEDMAELGTLGRLMATLLEVRRKAMPIPKIDPNESPNMLAARERARIKIAKAIESELSAQSPTTFRGGEIESIALDLICRAIDRLETIEAAALAHDWKFWGRPKQLSPEGNWRFWGFLTGRGFGKTLAISNYINDQVENEGVRLVCLIAQDEQSAIDIQVNGPSGLIATAPPWFKPKFEASALQVVWPNGARAYVRTPEAPGKIRGMDYDLAWASEIQSWPLTQREEAWSNIQLSVRIGKARIIWDATPKKRHPILKDLIKDAKDSPRLNRIVRGTTHENAGNLAEGYVKELERKYGGTSKGREELLGEMLEDSENATVSQKWIDKARRTRATLTRRVISIDPAVTERRGSDQTGIIEAGLGADGQAYVLGDYSGKQSPPAWAKIVLDVYLDNRCDLVLVETNKGGDLVTQNLRAAATERGLTVVVVGKDEKPKHTRNSVYVKEIHSRGEKQDRAQPMATAYERGRVSHVIGVDLASLEDTLTTWEPTPGARSPDDLDALTAAIKELLGLADNAPDHRTGFEGITQAQKELSAPRPQVSVKNGALAALFRGGGGGRI